jgi:N-acetylglucosamine kinase-like BadF-type ATPase
MLQALAPLQLTGRVEIANDASIGLLAGATEGWGVAVVAGTGCNCRGWDRHHREGRITGFGVFGEMAGAGGIVERALWAVGDAWTRRGPPTALVPAFVARTGARSFDDLIEGLSQQFYQLDASAAPVVFEVAAEGDGVARDIIAWAGCELGSMAVTVIRQLSLEGEALEVVLVGSLYDGGALLTEPMQATIHAVAPFTRMVRLAAPPVVGGALLGMEKAGVAFSAVREPLIDSTNQLLKKT